MSIEKIKNKLGDELKDTKLNLAVVLTEAGALNLNKNQIYLIGLACAYATKNHELISAIIADSTIVLSEAEHKAAKAAATIMAMNNVYYRFIHLVNDPIFASMPAKLRMNVLGNPGIHKADFELACLAISALNGCGMCIEAHVRELLKTEISTESIQAAVRIAAVLNATAMALSIIDH
ncbi:MAG: carboxymuconolactone decarboxylase family protein [Proteobacteria bacterium]|nr:carboxymuconolactone decarboxylase family protein [Pseudomonadota bacterium]